MPRSIDSLNKQTYPYRDHVLALRLLRILSKENELTTNETRENLGIRSPSQKKVRITFERLNELGYCEEHENINQVTKWMSLESLNKTKHMRGKFNPKKLGSNWERINGYTFHKLKSSNYVLAQITIDGVKQFCIESRLRRWKISFKGKLLLLISDNQSFRNFIKNNLENPTIKLVQILLDSNKRELVNMLKARLKNSYYAGLDLGKIANEWYDETTHIISKMNLNKQTHPILYKLKSEILDNKERISILKARNSTNY